VSDFLWTYTIQSVPGGKVNILGVIVSVILRKNRICTYDLFQIVSEVELFHCIVPEFLIRKRYYILFPIMVFTVQVKKVGTVYVV
jgi:hypothetical protein